MATDISIMISAKDNYSDAIKKMQKTQTAFRKDLGQLDKELTALNKNKITLKTDLTKAKRELSGASKAFAETGDEAARLRMEAAQADYDNIRQNLDLVSKAAKQTTKDMNNLTGVVSKSETSMGVSSGEGGTLAALAKAGVFAMVGNAAADLGGTLVSSAFGSQTGNAITSILGGAASGAALGSLGGAPGIALGAALGALTGAIQATTKIFESKDEAFKSVVQDEYDTLMQEQSDSLSNGSGLAASNEKKEISFSRIMGAPAKAMDFLEDIKDYTTSMTSYLEDDLDAVAKKLLTYGYDAKDILNDTGDSILKSLTDTGAALDLDASDIDSMAEAMGKMKTTGKVTMAYLNPFIERGIPVLDYLAEASGKTKDQILEMVSKGLIPGEKAAEAISDYMGYEFSGAAAQQAKTYEGLQTRLQGMQDEMDTAMGEGYNEQRKIGIQAEIDWLGGENGDKMAKANEYIGQFQADLENQKEELLRNKLTETMNKDEFQQADAVEKGRMLMEAKAEAQAEYVNSKGYQTQLDAETALIDQIQIDMKDSYYNAGYALSQKFNEGLINARLDSGEWWATPDLSEDALSGRMGGNVGGKAFGMPYVPYDDFPALLHEGERVLTASQNRTYESGGQGSMPMISGNNFYIREDADIDRVASALYEKIRSAQTSYVSGR